MRSSESTSAPPSNAARRLTFWRSLPGAGWQRCRTHYTTNPMAVTPKPSWPRCALCCIQCSINPTPNLLPVNIIGSPTHSPADYRRPLITLNSARPDLLAFTSFPKTIWRQTWSNNSHERLN